MKLTMASIAILLLVAGCKPVATPGGGVVSSGAKADVFAEAAKEQEEGEGPYIEPARPFLSAVASRDYAKVYAELSSHCKAKVFPHQFVPDIEEKQPKEDQAITNLTAEKCAELMTKMEAVFGVPEAVRHVYVETIDPNILAGKGDRLEVMFAIGGMPAEIPNNIRKASIRAQVQCQFSPEDVKKIAAELKISEDQVRSGKWPENDKGYDPDERPYMNVKFVLVEEEGKLKVGYFEFMPPSILD